HVTGVQTCALPISAVATYSNVSHVLTTEPEVIRRAAVVVFTSDRGLAGAFNANVLRESEELTTLLTEQGKEVVHYVVGRRGVGYFNFRRRTPERSWIGDTDTPSFATDRKSTRLNSSHVKISYA